MSEQQLRLACEPSSAGRARDFAAEYYQGEGIDREAADVAELVISELVTNAVLHGCSAVELRLWVGGHALGGEITDYGTGTPTLLQPPLTSTGGRRHCRRHYVGVGRSGAGGRQDCLV